VRIRSYAEYVEQVRFDDLLLARNTTMNDTSGTLSALAPARNRKRNQATKSPIDAEDSSRVVDHDLGGNPKNRETQDIEIADLNPSTSLNLPSFDAASAIARQNELSGVLEDGDVRRSAGLALESPKRRKQSFDGTSQAAMPSPGGLAQPLELSAFTPMRPANTQQRRIRRTSTSSAAEEGAQLFSPKPRYKNEISRRGSSGRLRTNRPPRPGSLTTGGGRSEGPASLSGNSSSPLTPSPKDAPQQGYESSPFKFRSFPASLPRVNNPHEGEEQIEGGGEDSLQVNVCSANQRISLRPKPIGTNQNIKSNPSFESTDNDAISDLNATNQTSSAEQDISGDWSESIGSVTHERMKIGNVPSHVTSHPNHAHFAEEDAIMEEDRDFVDTGDRKHSSSTELSGTNLNSIFGTDSAQMNESEAHPHTPRTTAEFQMHNLNMSPIVRLEDDEPIKSDAKQETLKQPLFRDQTDNNKSTTSTFTAASNSCNASKSSSTTNINNTTFNANMSRPNTARKMRPMPDTSAFDVQSIGSKDSGFSQSKAANKSDHFLCPPTPIRTPAWAQNDGRSQPLKRTNSLIATKVLAHASNVENLSYLEDSMLENDISGFATERSIESQTGSTLTSSFAPVEEEDGEDGEDDDKNASFSSVDASTKSNSISFNDFENLGMLGSGAFADVYKVRSKKDQRMFAIKRTRRQFRGVKDRAIAMSEVNTMKRLQSALLNEAASTSQGKSEGSGKQSSRASYGLYLLFFIRAWQQDGFFYCQTELCSRATCRHLRLSLSSDWERDLLRYPSLELCIDAASEADPLQFKGGVDRSGAGRLVPETAIWQICHDVSRGLFHIHSHQMVHYDIKLSNIFFVGNTKWGTICKIGDFGLAGDIGSRDDGQEGDTSYMANELLSSSCLKSPSADIFSLGLMIYELAANPMWNLPKEGDRWHQLRSGSHKLELPETRSPGLVELIRSMIRPDADERPSAEKLTETEEVKRASATVSSFLSRYIADVEQFDSRREQEMESAEEEARKRSSTPVASMFHNVRDTRTPTNDTNIK